MKKINLLVVLFLFVIGQSYAQSLGNVTKSTVTNQKSSSDLSTRIRCGSYEYEQMLRTQFPDLGSREEFETWLSKEIKKQEAKGNTRVVVTIPTVVHVVHNGENVGVGTNISQAQVNSQITVLNQDFRRTNPDASSTPSVFSSVAVDAEIEFCLALVDPNGVTLAQPGIDRINRNTKGWSTPPYSMSYIDATIKPNSIWDPTRYFNIWTLNLGNQLLGYAQFPNSSGLGGLNANNGAANTDGVVILYNAFGNTGNVAAPYNKGRTATHEVGHWLGLLHIWGDDGTSCTGSDNCADTPNQADENYGCPTFATNISCSNSGDMSMNYMDYTDDACMNLFTANQKTRMQTVMSVSPRRASLTTSTVCQATGGAPVANFSASPTTVCNGSTSSFTYTGTGATGATFAWSFPGGTPATSTLQNPVITYSTNGTYNVTCTVTNPQGTDTKTSTNFINVITCTTSGCDTLINIDAADTLKLYGSGGTGAWGYVTGHNNYGDIAKAEFYNYTGAATQMTGAIFGFGAGATNSTTATAQIKVWANNAGTPGAQLYSQNILLSTIEADAVAGNTTNITFTTPVNISGPFYLGVQYAYASGDTIGLISNQVDGTLPGTAWEMWSDNSWHPINEAQPNGWGLDLSLYAAPILCAASTGNAPVANFSTNQTTVCTGAAVNFTNTSTGAPTSYAWTFPGGNPASSTSANPSVTYAAAGTYSVTLVATNANGSDTELKTNYITVNAAPTAGFTNTPLGNGNYSFTSTSTGNPTAYSWNFGNGNTATTATATNTYTASGNYTVSLTVTNACGSNTTTQQITVEVVSIDNGFGGEVKIYPNPNSGAFTLEVFNTNADEIQYELFDIQGKSLFAQKANTTASGIKTDIEVNGLSEGTYILRVGADNKFAHYKLFIQK